MKKIIFLCLAFLIFPFLNSLFFVPSIKADTVVENPNRQVSFSADNMQYNEYQFFNNGVIRVNKGIYGYLFGTMYIVYYDKSYSYVPSGVDMSQQYKVDFKNNGRTFVIATIKRVPNTENQAVIRIRYPGSDYQYTRATVESELPFN